jgi:hypothetical protein
MQKCTTPRRCTCKTTELQEQQVWWGMSSHTAFRNLRQEVKASLGYTVRLSLKQEKKNKEEGKKTNMRLGENSCTSYISTKIGFQNIRAQH